MGWRGRLRICGGALATVVAIWPASAAAQPRIAPAHPAVDQAWSGDTAGSASAALGDGQTIDLFYGNAMLPEAWSARDRAEFTALVGSGQATLGLLYNQWLAIADLRAATYSAAGQLGPGGLVVYPLDPSAVLHALDLGLWAREDALRWLLGQDTLHAYPDFADLGYRDGAAYIGSTRRSSTLQPAAVDGVLNDLLLPSALFAGDRVMLMPYAMPGEYGVTHVIGPEIRVWLGADADVDLVHVLVHELGHAIHFRYGGYDTTIDSSGAAQPLSAFWQHYLALRGLSWQDPGRTPWSQQTPECFAEDVAALAVGPGDHYQVACPPPTDDQRTALLAWLRSLPYSDAAPMPFQQAGWVQWVYPWPSADFGDFHADMFTPEPTVSVSLTLDAQAAGGPYGLSVDGGNTTLATLAPGGGWGATLTIPPSNQLEIDAGIPGLTLSWLDVYRNAAFVPTPRVSGVFPDTLDSWARADIAAAVRTGIVGGYPDGSFRPGGAVTRAEFARMLATALPARLFQLPGGPMPPTWTDIPSGSWEEPFVAAVGSLLPGAVGAGAFAPSAPLTRQEAAAWVSAAFGWPAMAPDRADAILATYPDGAAVNALDAGAFAAALSQGLLAGDAVTGALRPGDTITRAQAAILVLRAAYLAAQ